MPRFATAQSASTASLPSPVSLAVNVAGPSGDIYEAYATEGALGGALEVVRVTPLRKLVWAQMLTLGQAPTPGGIAVDPFGNTYVSFNDLPRSASGLVKLSANGVFISSAVPPYNGGAFSPLILDVDLDTTTSRLYSIQTIVDPNSGGQTRVLVLEYDWALNPLAAKLIGDASWIADEANGLRVDVSRDIRVGVTEYAAGSELPGYEVVTLSPSLTQTLSIQPTGAAVDFLALVACSTSGPTTALVGASFPLTLTVGDPALGSASGGATIQFSYSQVPSGASGYSLSPIQTLTNSNGQATTEATLGDSAGAYSIGTAIYLGFGVPATCYPGPGGFEILATVSQQLTLNAAPGPFVGTVTKALPRAVTVKVQDAQGNPAAGIPISFSVAAPSGTAGQLTITSTSTLADGTASTSLTFGNLVGTYTVTATCAQCVPSTMQLPAQAELRLVVTASSATIQPVTNAGAESESLTFFSVTATGISIPTDVVGNYQVVLVSTAVQTSGGHNHGNARPTGQFVGATTPSTTGGATGFNGSAYVVEYIASPFGGTELISAVSASDPGVQVTTLTVTEQMPNLALLPDTTYYVKSGGTCNHYGPSLSGIPVVCQVADNNHYVFSAPVIDGDPESNPEVQLQTAAFAND